MSLSISLTVNGVAHAIALEDPRVTLKLRSEVQTVETSAGVVSAVNYLQEGVPQRDTGDLFVLGASALFNPHILLRSGFKHPLIGRRLHEHVCDALVLLRQETGRYADEHQSDCYDHGGIDHPRHLGVDAIGRGEIAESVVSRDDAPAT